MPPGTAPQLGESVVPPYGVADARQQCWECLRRRWVCDASRPVCNKCRSAGIVCPGYNDQKPLTWLAPGRVTSRTRRRQPENRKRRQKSTAQTTVPTNASTTKRGKAKSSKPSETNADTGRNSDVLPTDRKQESSDHTKRSSQGPVSNAPHTADGHQAEQTGRVTDLERSVDDIDEAINYYNTQIYPNLVSHQLAPNPFVVPVTSTDAIPPSLRHALVSMTMSHRIRRIAQTEAATDESGVYPQQSPAPSHDTSSSSSPTPSAARESLSSAVSASSSVTSPSSTRENTEAHDISQSTPKGHVGADFGTPEPGSDSPAVRDMWRRLHHHMGLAIHALNDEISSESSRNSDATIISVLVFLIAELQNSVSPHWRPHVQGLMALITMRGGLGKLIDSSAHLKPALLSFTILAVIANTTSPPTEQLSATTHLDMIDLISQLYSVGVFPSLPCPLPLFVDIIHINHLRLRAATDPMACVDNTVQGSAALLLSRIEAFSPELWLQNADKGPLSNNWLLIAQVFQSAVILYATSSLPWAGSLCPVSANASMVNPRNMRLVHRARLFSLLEVAMQSSVVNKGMVWPLVVAGVEAATGSKNEKDFVESRLAELSRTRRVSYPLVAKAALEKFWKSGSKNWDDCFNQPFAILA